MLVYPGYTQGIPACLCKWGDLQMSWTLLGVEDVFAIVLGQLAILRV